MTRVEFVSKLFDAPIDFCSACKGIEADCDEKGCSNCKYDNFWFNEIDVPALCKKVINILYGVSSEYILTGVRSNGKKILTETALFFGGWERLPKMFNNVSFTQLVDILNDAQDNGFEVRVINGVIYYRERGYQNTDSTQDVD